MTRHFAYYRQDGVVQFTSSLHDGIDPPDVAGLQSLEIEDSSVVDGMVVIDGALSPLPPPEESVVLERDRAARWVTLKAERDAFEDGSFEWDGSRFDADPQSQSRIQGAALLALMASLQGQPFEVDWTLANNDVRRLSGSDMIAVGEALAQHVGAAHAIGRELRAALKEAQTRTEIEAVNWPP
jgi:hypothetical protein